MSSPTVSLELTLDEALVLFDWLNRQQEIGRFTIEDDAEFIALAGLICLLEKQLVEPFMPNYGELLDKARHAIRNPQED